jgi:hypothetical protein
MVPQSLFYFFPGAVIELDLRFLAFAASAERLERLKKPETVAHMILVDLNKSSSTGQAQKKLNCNRIVPFKPILAHSQL